MSIYIKVTSAEEYERTEYAYTCSNFLQSAKMYHVFQELYPRDKSEFLLFCKLNEGKEDVVGQALVRYRKKFRFFKEAVILQGPLLDYSNLDLLEEILIALKSFFKQKKVASWLVQPYYFLASNLQEESIDNQEDKCVKDNFLLSTFNNLGYKRIANYQDVSAGILQMFVKPLLDYANLDELYAAYNPALKRNFKKYAAFGVEIKKLTLEEMPLFYEVLEATGVRKNFKIKQLDYFLLMKKYFPKELEYYLAYLDLNKYRSFLLEQIEIATNNLAQIEKDGLNKKNRGLKVESEKNKKSFEKRLAKLGELTGQDEVVLSAYMLLSYGNEAITLMGGNHASFLNFGGSTLLNERMIKDTYLAGYKKYNFYGTMEVEDALNNQGNFNFKRQFGGSLERLAGYFTYKNSYLLKILSKLKG